MENWEKNLLERPKSVIGDLITEGSIKNTGAAVISTASDIGVIRNGGIKGTKFGPKAIMYQLKKLNITHPVHKLHHLTFQELVQSNLLKPEEFDEHQSQLINQWKSLNKNIPTSAPILHLGGGHDHIFPFLSGLFEDNAKEVLVINIDAHLDTRNDQFFHSGTPFRQIANKLNNRLSLIQIGIHSYANHSDNYSGIKDMTVLHGREVRDIAGGFSQFLEGQIEKHPNHELILSVDCDGLDGSYMPAVSAPNHHGLTKDEMEQVLIVCKKYWELHKKRPFLGLYEYNPLLDSTTGVSARYLADLCYRFLL